ncbi:MAG TPA: triose-phosphate isomerase [Erysipelotrichaceae bacterium]|nr:triose-phosphate isomerase [Erysipelotrichaceae bacterium]
MRKPIIVGNWKMNKTNTEAIDFVKGIEEVLHDGADFGVAPAYVALKDAKANAKDLIIAAQNVHFEDSGAFTGEVSVEMLKDLNVKWAIVGHSERRAMFNETDETVNKKIKQLVANDMYAIACCGESLEQFEAKETEAVVRAQVKGMLEGLDAADVKNLVIAYEPIWAIGTGKSATTQIAQDTCAIVRDEVRELYDDATAEAVRIQYGGSVNPSNIKEYMSQPDIDGALIGGASLKVDSFTEVINAVK